MKVAWVGRMWKKLGRVDVRICEKWAKKVLTFNMIVLVKFAMFQRIYITVLRGEGNEITTPPI